MKNNKFFSRVFDDDLSPIAWLGYLKEHNLSEEDEKKINDLYTVDLENDIFICDGGAVVSGVRVTDDVSQETLDSWFKEIRYNCRANVPYKKRFDVINGYNYKLNLIPGSFPFIKYSEDGKSSIIWTSHIVVISNYKELLDEQNKKIQSDISSAVAGLDFVRTSYVLPGAIGTTYVFPGLVFLDGHEIECDQCAEKAMADLVPKDKFHEEQDLFVNENGAVLNAFDFSNLSDSVKELAIMTVLKKYESEYPDYKISLKEGEFPMNYTYTRRAHYVGEDVQMSSHILYVENYQKHLVSDNAKSGFNK